VSNVTIPNKIANVRFITLSWYARQRIPGPLKNRRLNGS